MRKRTYKVTNHPLVHSNMVRVNLRWTASEWKEEAQNEAVRLWQMTLMLPSLTGEELLDIVQGRVELETVDDGLIITFPHVEPPEPDMPPQEEIDLLVADIRGRLGDDGLDELVHDVYSRMASEVNNQGMEEQVRDLLDAHGFTIAQIAQHCRVDEESFRTQRDEQDF